MLGQVLVVLVLAAGGSYAREYNCTVDESLCTGNGAQTIFVSGLRMCCPPQATFSLNNNNCLCVEPDVQGEQQCLEGVSQCRDASSFSTSGNGVVRCCMAGYALNSVSNSYVNGVLMDFCTCTPMPSGAGGFMHSVIGMGGPAINTLSAQSTVSRPINATEARDQWRQFTDSWRTWGDNFARDARQWGNNFGNSMHNTGLDLARGLSGTLQTTLRGTIGPLQRALNDMVGNVFRSIPGF